jgi:hypothetical protein
MASPLASIYSTADSFKRKLLDVLTDPAGSAQQIVGNANDRAGVLNALTGQLADQTMSSIKAGGSVMPDTPESQQLTQMMADAYNPAGVVLLHGGRFPVDRVDPELLRTGVHSGGFHTTNKAVTPQTFATNANDGKGFISMFDFPDELYNKSIMLSNKPIDAGTQDAVTALIQKDPALGELIVKELKMLYSAAKQEGTDVKPADLLTGQRLNSLLRRHYGGINQSEEAMAGVGIPAKSWVYRAERPNEIATAVYPQSVSELRPLGQIETERGGLLSLIPKLKEMAAKQGLQYGK